MSRVKKQLLCTLLLFMPFALVAQDVKVSPTAGSYYAVIVTDMGEITVRLYDATPLHRDNFKKLSDAGFYDGVIFHRVIDGFMIQTGDPDSKDAKKGVLVGEGGPGYDIDAEIVEGIVHRRGVLAAAREGDELNPQRRSSGSQFYLTLVPTTHLDGKYTVFGEITRGFEVIDKIGKSPTDEKDRPTTDIRVKKIKVKRY